MKWVVKLKSPNSSFNSVVEAKTAREAIDKAFSEDRVKEVQLEINYVWVIQNE